MKEQVHNMVRKWITEILDEHRGILEIALCNKARFEEWLKFELAQKAREEGAQVGIEISSENVRVDLVIFYNNSRSYIELKVIVTNYYSDIKNYCKEKLPPPSNGERGKDTNRPITVEITGIVNDATKLKKLEDLSSSNKQEIQKIVAFVAFPVPQNRKDDWEKHLRSIGKLVGSPLSSEKNCSSILMSQTSWGKNHIEFIVCTFTV